jgi:hypothetical protein
MWKRLIAPYIVLMKKRMLQLSVQRTEKPKSHPVFFAFKSAGNAKELILILRAQLLVAALFYEPKSYFFPDCRQHRSKTV